jgi:hypothetical protein
MESGQDGAHLFLSSRISSPAPFPSVTGFDIRTATYFLRPTLVSPVKVTDRLYARVRMPANNVVFSLSIRSPLRTTPHFPNT